MINDQTFEMSDSSDDEGWNRGGGGGGNDVQMS